jgi:hypothetical protein
MSSNPGRCVVLCIDDDRSFGPSFNGKLIVYARDSASAIAFIETSWEIIAEIFFDHDLGGDDTSMRVVDYIDEKVFRNELAPDGRVFRIQSANPPGAQRIREALSRHHFEYKRELPPVTGYVSRRTVGVE